MRIKVKTILHAFAAVILFFLTDSFCHQLVRMAVSVCSQAIFLTALYTCLDILNVLIVVFLYSKHVLKASLTEMYLGKPFPASRWCMAALAVPLAADAVYFIFTKGEFKTGFHTTDELTYILFHEVFSSGFRIAITEGIIFRGMLFRILQKGFGNKAGLFVSSFFYASASFVFYNCFAWNEPDNPGMFLLIFFIGLAFTLITLETGSVWFSVIIHFLYNAFSGNAYILHIDTKQDFPAIFTYTMKNGGMFFTDIPMPHIAVFLAVSILTLIRIKKKGWGNDK